MKVILLFFIVCLAGSYCGMSFYYFNFDPSAWHRDARASMIIIAFFGTAFMCGAIRNRRL